MSEVIQISNAIWCLRNRSYFACSYLVKSQSGLVLIDAGMSSNATEMINAIHSIGFKPVDIRGILLTHWHNDHAAGAHIIGEVSNAPIFYHEAEALYFNGTSRRSGILTRVGDCIPEMGLFVLFKGLISNALPNPVIAHKYVIDDETLLDDFQVIATPGHTPGHVSYYFRPEKALFAGDALAIVGNRIQFMSRFVTPNKSQALHSMKKCVSKDIQIICPGHRNVLTQGVLEALEKFKIKLKDSHWPLFG